jgi:methionyl-tRNA synthetase
MTEGLISFKDWEKLDLKVGEIINVEEIEGADKLYKLVIDIGHEKRIICAGIRLYYSVDNLKNKKIIVIINLQPKKTKGIEGQGMIFAAVNKSQVILISPERDIVVGSKIR